jgi:hypothetical protein
MPPLKQLLWIRSTSRGIIDKSPDLAPYEFFLFGSMKGKLGGRQYETPEDLFCEVRSIIEGIRRTFR